MDVATILGRMSDAYFALDADWRFLDVNSRAENDLGRSRSSLVGCVCWEVFPGAKTSLSGLELSRAAAEGRPVEFTARPFLTDRSALVTAFPDSDGLHVFFHGVAEVGAEEAQARLAAIVESSDDAIISKDPQGKIVSWNRAAELILGYSASEVIGRPIALIAPPNHLDEMPRLLAAVLRGEKIEHFETKRRRKDGVVIDVSLTVSPVKDSKGRIIGASKVLRDISAARRRKDAILEAERSARAEAERASRLKDEFLATLSHEIRTPLSAIVGWVHLIRGGGLSEEDAKKGLEIIERNSRAQARIIDDLLDMSRILSGKFRLDVQCVDLVSVIEGALEANLAAVTAKEIRVVRMLDPHAAQVTGDPGRLQQVFWNLLSNAAKFTPRGGRIEVKLAREGSRAEITVSDTGEGIEPSFLPHVFERFSQADASITRKHPGLGIGMSIVKQLVEMHGGSVDVKSAGRGLGATFTVSLPIAIVREDRPESGFHADDSSEHPLQVLSGVKILVVDDESEARDLIARLLESREATVVKAGSAEDALECLEREKPDVLVSDIGMPDVDGYEFIRRVRALPPEKGGQTPALALTAFARSVDRTRALIAGYGMHISKPVEPTELVASIASLARRGG